MNDRAPELPEGRESAMVVIERDAQGTPTVFCDPEIADLVRALNLGGVRTIASCSGHGVLNGWIALKDGRQLVVTPDLDSAKPLIQRAAGLAQAEPLRWEATTPCYTRFVTDSRYRKFSPAVQKWYRPICDKCGPAGVPDGHVTRRYCCPYCDQREGNAHGEWCRGAGTMVKRPDGVALPETQQEKTR